MSIMRFLLSFMLLLLFLFTPTNSQTPISLNTFCNNSTKKPLTTSYKTNVNKVLQWMNTISSTGQESNLTSIGSNKNDHNDTVYGNYDCRGDIPAHFCNFCVNSAVKEISQTCTNGTSAIIFYDMCILRYSNKNFFGKINLSPSFNLTGPKTIKDSRDFAKAESLMKDLIRKTTDANRMWATSVFDWNGTEKRYGLVQCAGDLDNNGCKECLKELIDRVAECCGTSVMWGIVAPSCGVRFDDKMFFQVSSEQPGSSSLPNPGNIK